MKETYSISETLSCHSNADFFFSFFHDIFNKRSYFEIPSNVRLLAIMYNRKSIRLRRNLIMVIIGW